MPIIEDHSYIKICAQLANQLSISIASAKRKVDLAAIKLGVKDLENRKSIAEKLLDEAILANETNENQASANFDNLLEALKQDENFMVED